MMPASLAFNRSGALCWIAPGEDWNVGTAASYELREFSTKPTPETFAGGAPLAGAPPPASAGTQQCATITTTAAYVGLRAIDSAGNISYPAAARVKTRFPKP
jgi:hypothetical protein